MFLFVLILHFILCAILVGLVLIQQGKGADMGAAFGAGSSNSLFGAGGATSLIVRITTGTAVAFMVTSIALINLSGSDSGLASFSSKPANEQSLAGSVMEGASNVNPSTETQPSSGEVKNDTNEQPGAAAQAGTPAQKPAESDQSKQPVQADAVKTEEQKN